MSTDKTTQFYKFLPGGAFVAGFVLGITLSRSNLSYVRNNLFSQVFIALLLAAIFYTSSILIRDKSWKTIITGKKPLIILLGITAYNTLVFSYNKLIPEKLFYIDRLTALGYGFLCFVIIFFSEITFLYLINKGSRIVLGRRELIISRQDIDRFRLIIFGILIGIWGFYLFASFPGVMTIDSFSHWRQAIGEQELSDWHPAFYTLLIRLFTMIWKSPAAIIIFQILWMGLVLAWGFSMFYRRGLPAKILYGFTILFAVIPINGLYLVNIQSNTPFTISFIWLVFLLMALVWDEVGFTHNWFYLISLFLALSLTSLFRHNGIYIVIGVCIVLLIWALRKKEYLLFGPIIAWIIAFTIVSGPLYNALKIPPTPKAFINGILMQDIAGVYNRGGELSDNTLKTMKRIMPLAYWQQRYNEYTVDTYFFPTGIKPRYPDYISKISNLPTNTVLILYADTLMRSPIDTIRSRITQTSILWNITRPANDGFGPPVIWRPEKMKAWGERMSVRGIDWHPNGVTELINWLAEYSRQGNSVLFFFFWRPGIANAVILLLAFYWFSNRRTKNFVILTPFLFSFATLLISVPTQDARYIWHHIIFAILLVLFTLVDFGERPALYPAGEKSHADAPE